MVQRIEDVQQMCEKRRHSLKRVAATRGPRPVQPVSPEPHVICAPGSDVISGEFPHRGSLRSSSGNSRRFHRTRTDTGSDSFSSSGSSDFTTANHSDAFSLKLRDTDLLTAKRGHVMRELIDSERSYVEELRAILDGYCAQMDNPALQALIPASLRGRQDVLFGNMKQIYEFHAK